MYFYTHILKKEKKLEVFKNNFNLVYIQVKVIFVIIKKLLLMEK